MQEFTEIEERRSRKVRAIFESSLAISRDRKDGYAATWSNFVSSTRNDGLPRAAGPGPTDLDGVAMVDSLFPFLKNIINDCSKHMAPLLRRLGVTSDEISPFCREFETPADLLAQYEECFKRTKIFENDACVEIDCEEDNEEDIEVISIEGVKGKGKSFDETSVQEIINAALEVDESGNDPVDVDLFTDVNVDSIFGEDKEPPAVMEGLQKVLTADSLNGMAEAARAGIFQVSVKKTGSVSYDTKHKSLRERWMSPRPIQSGGNDEKDPHAVLIKRNVHVKVEISEGRGASKMTAIENFVVLCVFTKTYNKWMPCDVGEQLWKKGTKKGKYRVLLRMIQYDHLMAKYKHVMPSTFGKWGKKSMFVLCDASKIVDVVQMLSAE